MKDTTENQTAVILNFLLLGCEITSLEALHYFGCFNLKGRIFDIKKFYGIEPDRKLIPVPTKYGKKYVMKYWVSQIPQKTKR